MIAENVVVGVYDGTVNTNGIIMEFNESEFKGSKTYPIFADGDSFIAEDPVQVVGKARLRFDRKTKELIATNVVIYDEQNVDTTSKFLCSGGYSSTSDGVVFDCEVTGGYPSASDVPIFNYTVKGLFFSAEPADHRIEEFSPKIAESSKSLVNSEIEVIMPAKDIPNESKVRKITGKYLYTLRNNVTVDGKAIHESSDKVFLFGNIANISSFDKDKKLVWIVEKDILKRFLASQEV